MLCWEKYLVCSNYRKHFLNGSAWPCDFGKIIGEVGEVSALPRAFENFKKNAQCRPRFAT